MKIRAFKLSKSHGFTLIEVILSISILSLLLVMFFSFFSWLNYYLFTFSKETDLYTESRSFIEAIESDEFNSDLLVYYPENQMVVFYDNSEEVATYLFHTDRVERTVGNSNIEFRLKLNLMTNSLVYTAKDLGVIGSICFINAEFIHDIPICITKYSDAETLYSLEKKRDENSGE